MSEDPTRESRPADPFATPQPTDAGRGDAGSPGYGPPTSYPDPYSSADPYAPTANPSSGAPSYGASSYGAPGHDAAPSYGAPSYGAPGHDAAPYGAPAPGPYGAYPPHPGQAGPYPAYAPVAPTNGMAVASLVCGVLGFGFWFPWLLALIFGYIGRRQIRERGEGGDGMAVAGIVLGWIGVAFTLLFVVFIAIAIAADS